MRRIADTLWSFLFCGLATMSRNLVQISKRGGSFLSESNFKNVYLCPTQCIICSQLVRVWAHKASLGSQRFYKYWECVLKRAFNNAKMGHFQCLTVPQWPWAPPFFILNSKFTYDEYSVDKFLNKNILSLLFQRNYLKSCVKSRELEIKSAENICFQLKILLGDLDFLHARTSHDGTSNIKVSGKITQ